ncbi:hypothetical protein N0V92_006443 [Colletotrichum tropicale]|nr:hypothetical protein N0V92_006443 [Colletotrichum tropicale]
MATDMKTDNEDPVKVDSQKKKYDTTDESRASFEGQTTEWPARPLPELLRHLSEDELKNLEKKLIRKVDMRMLPTMILIYIMNYLDSAWYVRKELGVRTGLFYSGSMLSGAFSGLIAAGITNGMDGLGGLLAWRWLFIIEGSLTVLIACGAFFILPDFPANTKWLTEQERQMAMWRMEVDAAGEEDWTSSSEQPIFAGFKMIMVDPINWILVVLVYGAASSISINSFFPTVVGSLGKDRITTLLLTSPPYLLACIACAAVSWNADRTNERFWHTVAPLACSLLGFIISSAATGIGPRYFGAMIMLPGIYTGFNMSMVWTANTMYRPAAKRAAAVAFNNAFSTLAGIYGSYLYPNNAAPRFVLAFSVNAAMAFMAIIAAVVLHFVLKRENKKLALKEQEAEAAVQVITVGKGFRYLV